MPLSGLALVRTLPLNGQFIEAVNQLMAPPDPPKRPIGFVMPKNKGKKTS